MSQVPLGADSKETSLYLRSVPSTSEKGLLAPKLVWIFQKSFLQEPPPHTGPHASIRSALKRIFRFNSVSGLQHRDKRSTLFF